MRLVGRLQLLRGLLGGGRAYNPPFYVDVDLTDYCNFQCAGCRYHSPLLSGQMSSADGNIPVDLLLRFACEIRALGTRSITLQGAGEPLLHPEISRIAPALKDLGFHVTILTNGALLDEDISRSLVECGLDVLRVSLWAANGDGLAPDHRGFDLDVLGQVVRGVKNLIAARARLGRRRPAVWLHLPINNANYGGIPAVVELALSLGCDGLSFSPFATARGELGAFSLSGLQRQVTRDLLRCAAKQIAAGGLGHNVAETLRRYAIGAAVWQALPCYAAWYHARIRSDGRVQPCGRCDSSFGNIREQPFTEIWNGRAIRDFRRAARSRQGLAVLESQCDCNYCCFVRDNRKVHRAFGRFLLRRDAV